MNFAWVRRRFISVPVGFSAKNRANAELKRPTWDGHHGHVLCIKHRVKVAVGSSEEFYDMSGIFGQVGISRERLHIPRP